MEFKRLHDLPPSELTATQIKLLTELTTDPTMVRTRAEEALQRWQTRKRELAAATSAYRANLPEASRGTLGKLDLFLLEEMIVKSGSIDVQFARDLSDGLPITGNISSGGLGEVIPGGQRVNRKPGLGGAKPLEELRAQCAAINARTLRRAQSKLPRSEDDCRLAVEAWAKVQKDIRNGHAGVPIKLADSNMTEGLLVDTFGVWERHAGANWKVRVISNFRGNQANDYAWMIARLRYDGFDHLLQALSVLGEAGGATHEPWEGGL